MPATLWAIFAGLVTFAFLLSLLAFFLWLYDRALAVIMSVCYPPDPLTVFSAFKGVFTVALYGYATQREAPVGFSADLIKMKGSESSGRVWSASRPRLL